MRSLELLLMRISSMSRLPETMSRGRRRHTNRGPSTEAPLVFTVGTAFSCFGILGFPRFWFFNLFGFLLG